MLFLYLLLWLCDFSFLAYWYVGLKLIHLWLLNQPFGMPCNFFLIARHDVLGIGNCYKQAFGNEVWGEWNVLQSYMSLCLRAATCTSAPQFISPPLWRTGWLLRTGVGISLLPSCDSSPAGEALATSLPCGQAWEPSAPACQNSHLPPAPWKQMFLLWYSLWGPAWAPRGKTHNTVSPTLPPLPPKWRPPGVFLRFATLGLWDSSSRVSSACPHWSPGGLHGVSPHDSLYLLALCPPVLGCSFVSCPPLDPRRAIDFVLFFTCC